MKISVLNGYSRVVSAPGSQMVASNVSNGYNRVFVNYAANGYALNGVTTEMDLFQRLPRHIQSAYIMDRALGNPVTINGLKDWIAQRKEKKADKQQFKDEKRDIKLAKLAAGEDLGSKLGNVAVQAAQQLSSKALALIPGSSEEQAVMEAMYETPDSAAAESEKGLFNKKNWWQKLETWQQVAIGVGGAVALDYAARGPISKGLGYARKGKGKK